MNVEWGYLYPVQIVWLLDGALGVDQLGSGNIFNTTTLHITNYNKINNSHINIMASCVRSRTLCGHTRCCVEEAILCVL